MLDRHGLAIVIARRQDEIRRRPPGWRPDQHEPRPTGGPRPGSWCRDSLGQQVPAPADVRSGGGLHQGAGRVDGEPTCRRLPGRSPRPARRRRRSSTAPTCPSPVAWCRRDDRSSSTPEAGSSSEMVKPSSTVSGGQAWAQASKQVVSPAGSLVKAYRVWPFAPTITSPRSPTVARSTTGASGAAGRFSRRSRLAGAASVRSRGSRRGFGRSRCHRRRLAGVALDQRAVGTLDEPDPADALTVGLPRRAVTGVEVQRPLADLELLGAVRPVDGGDQRRDRPRPAG